MLFSKKVAGDDDPEYVYIKVQRTDKSFFVFIKERRFCYQKEYTNNLNSYVEDGFFEAPYDGPELSRYTQCTSLRNVSGAQGWLIVSAETQQLWRFLANAGIQKFFQGAKVVEVTDQFAENSAKLVRILPLCHDCQELEIYIRDANYTQDARSSQPISLSNLQSLKIWYDDASRQNLSRFTPFYAFFQDLHELRGLYLYNVPLYPQSLRNLCVSGLQEFEVGDCTEPEFRLVLRALEANQVRLNRLGLAGVTVPVGLESPCLGQVSTITAENMSQNSVNALLYSAGSNVVRLSLMNIPRNHPSQPGIVQGLLFCPKLHSLSIFGCPWVDYGWLQVTCSQWTQSGMQKLDELRFDQGCGLNMGSFPDPYVLGWPETGMTSSVLLLPQTDDFDTQDQPIGQIREGRPSEKEATTRYQAPASPPPAPAGPPPPYTPF